MIGDKIKSIRMSLKLSQRSFGDKCGLSNTTISDYESGKKQPKHESLEKMITAFNINPRVFFENKKVLANSDKKTAKGSK